VYGQCQKPDRQGGLLAKHALPDGRASDTNHHTHTHFKVFGVALSPHPQPFSQGVRRESRCVKFIVTVDTVLLIHGE